MKKEKLQSKMILQVHDELIFDAAKDEAAHLTEVLKKRMSEAMEMEVPMEVEANTGSNWLEAH